MDTKKAAKIFKALSNPNRLELYFKIAEMHESSFPTDTDSECFVTDIIRSLNIGAPTISHHIKELVNADLISTEKKGKFLICKVNEELIEEVSKLLSLQQQ
ncbi:MULTISPECIES: metalloregulator ArsR/SmtB family transcription factor [Desulfosporosinus]|uniref:ArsR/SmtB family transcription factor n=1 Tax=Desulfosporosinus TaxID=79206 RepID=UPI00207D0BB0|nr:MULTISPECIES: metalloregulator ArsR/SmtB family transcription factor [Desulfosporosinus]MCO1604770.1 metalloregulator ArsR/SmtB family transcription factor [Desulfosporosinus nitroreducens]MCO5387315.1 metalloregulator ArsR/SmtB family transcription factor [Desulfosporosinus sp.]MDA8221657.1 metalloregulator ArsR/SmtB family transcription factor [Desulfitobacterium hafniense]